MIDRISTTAAIAVRQAGAYTDLILSDLEASSRLMRQRLVWAAATLVALHLAVIMAGVLVIALSWDTPYRFWVIGALLLGFAGIASVSAWRLGLVGAGAPGVLSQTAREWAKDRRLLEELLQQQKAGAG
jgi:uncharacterized membrane protein YqjE